MSDVKHDARKLERTKTPGIYRRRNADGTLGQYVAIFRAGGKQRRVYAATIDEARRLKREAEAARDRGEWEQQSAVTLRAYLAEWIDSYRGNGRRGFRDGTREEYRRLLDAYAHRFFSDREKLTEITPHRMAQFVAWLADDNAQRRRHAAVRAEWERRNAELSPGERKYVPRAPSLPLADATIRNAVIPVSAALATAKRQGLIRHNPANDLALPVREQIHEDDEEQAKALTREQLALVLERVPATHRLLVRLVASTGLRISEAIALQRRHLQLDGSAPRLLVRRAIVRGRLGPPKSRHGRRAVPLPFSLVSQLRDHLAGLEDPSPDALVFPSQAGTPLDPDNIRTRTLKPIFEEAGVPWGGWHCLRHTYASLQLAGGANLLQLSRALGHHSPAFTLNVYAHLLGDDMAPALDLDAELRVNTGVNEPSGNDDSRVFLTSPNLAAPALA